MGYKEALQFLGRDVTEVETESEEIRVEGRHAERVAPSNMLDNPAPVPEAETNEQELEAPQLTEESAEHPAEQPPAKEPATKPGEQPEIEERQATPAQIGEIETEAVEAAIGQKDDAEENLGEGVGDEVTPDSVLFLGRKAAEELEPRRATLAAATILPLSLLGSKRAWVWIVVLVCVAIAGYLLIRWYSGRGKSTSPPEQEPQTVDEFMNNF